MSLWEGSWVSEQQAEEQLRQVQAIVEGDRKARMSAHRYKEPEVARSIHTSCLSSAEYHDERGNACMAHAKRLQAKYWARRMGITNDARYEQLKLDVPGYSYVDQLMRRQG